jgi:MFS family permease
MATYLLTLHFQLSSLIQAGAVTIVAMALVALIFRTRGASSPALRSRDLVLMYISAVPILYTLWFFGFWALMVVAESSKMGISGAIVYAGLFGIANAAGYPLGGWLCDRSLTRGGGRRTTYVALAVALAAAIAMLAFVMASGLDILWTGLLLFVIGILFAAMQTVNMTLTGDLAPRENLGEAFGMWNLVAEIGAVISPVLSGTLRDLTGNWTAAILLDALLVASSAILVFMVRESSAR